MLTQPMSSFVYISDLLLGGFAVIGCTVCKRKQQHITLNFIETSIALGSKAVIFAREDEMPALKIFTSDFSLHNDLVIPRFIHSPRFEISLYG